MDKGENARMASFVGALAIADLVKSTLGPKGMGKLLTLDSRRTGTRRCPHLGPFPNLPRCIAPHALGRAWGARAPARLPRSSLTARVSAERARQSVPQVSGWELLDCRAALQAFVGGIAGLPLALGIPGLLPARDTRAASRACVQGRLDPVLHS